MAKRACVKKHNLITVPYRETGELKMYRLTIYPAIDIDTKASMQIEFKTRDEMVAAKETSADLLLFLQDEMTLMKDYSNMFIEEAFIDDEWQELDED